MQIAKLAAALDPKPALEESAIVSTHSQTCSSVKADLAFPIARDLNGSHAVQVDNCRPVNAAKQPGVEVALKIRHAASQQVGLGADVEARVVIRSLNPIDLRRAYEEYLAGAFDDDAFHFARTGCGGKSFFGAAESAFETGIIKGFQQVVERAGLERAQGELIMRGDKDSRGRKIGAEHFKKIESVVVGHLNVKENQVRPDAVDGCEGLSAGAAFANELDFRIALEEYRQAAPSQWFIVNDYSTNSCELPSQLHFSRNGRLIDT